MRKLFFLLLAIFFAGDVYSQANNKFWIVFTDKNGSPYSVGNPSAYLSQRAIQRRIKQGIAVKLNDLPPNPAYIDSVLSKGVKLLNRSGWFNAISIYAPDTTKLAAIRALPFVKSDEPANIIKHHDYSTVPAIPKAETGKYSYRPVKADSDYTGSFGQVHMLKVDCLNNMGYRGKGKQIAVIDVHFGEVYSLPAFDTLRTRGQILGMWDFVTEEPSVYDSTNADNHGEMVLSCMAGNLPGQLLGDAMDADYYLFRTDENVSFSADDSLIEVENWASAAEYADSAGADIISTSLGYTTMYPINYTYADMNGKTVISSAAATIAAEKGLVVCAAAGNDGSDSWHYIGSPADADSILTVGAVDASGNYAYFSSTGPTSDRRLKPDVAAQGESTVLASPSGGITTGSGTSFATPLIAGGVASLWQIDSTATNMQIIKAIEQSASIYSSPDSLLGYGVPDFCIANSILSVPEYQPVSELVKTYPDPFTSSITLTFFSSLRQNIDVTMYNSIGQKVYQSNHTVAAGGNTLISLSGLGYLTSGLYFMEITDKSGAAYACKVMKL